MQILGRKSRILLVAVAIAMLAALGFSFALWDIAPAKAANADASVYANAKVGEIIEFGQYYQTLQQDAATGEYVKTPIQWRVVEKNERAGQLTLLSDKLLTNGSFFGNYIYNASGQLRMFSEDLVGNAISNQAYAESTLRAYLNNLVRYDLGGDAFETQVGYLPSYQNSLKESGLLASVGFSNSNHYTGLRNINDSNLATNPDSGFSVRSNDGYLYFRRPIHKEEYKNRPAVRGFYDEAFSIDEKSMIVPKQIEGYEGKRWPNTHDMSLKKYVNGVTDKVWVPSAIEMGIEYTFEEEHAVNYAQNSNAASSSTVFEYFKNYQNYGFPNLSEALKTTPTELVDKGESAQAIYSIPLYNRTDANNKALTVFSDFHPRFNISRNTYWLRTPSGYYASNVMGVFELTDNETGKKDMYFGQHSNYHILGVRPAIIIKY